MSLRGGCDFSELRKFKKLLVKMADENNLNGFFEDCAKELALRLYKKVVQRTPVGKSAYIYEAVRDSNGGKVRYKKGKNKGKVKKKRVNTHTGGTLRRNWFIGDIEKAGDCYRVYVSNPTEYAGYVEFGHRQTPGRFVPAIGKRLKKNWVDGRFMLTISEQEIKKITPRLLEKKILEYLRRCFND